MARPDLTVHQFIDSLRGGPYTSFGSYPLFWITADGETLSHEACKRNALRIARAIKSRSEPEWRVVAYDANWEDPDMVCADTGKRIESAYAEDCAPFCRCETCTPGDVTCVSRD